MPGWRAPSSPQLLVIESKAQHAEMAASLRQRHGAEVWPGLARRVCAASSRLPSEGTGAEIGSMSIVKNGPNTEQARKFYEWALTPGGQQFGLVAKQFQLPSNTKVAKDPRMTDPAKIKLINYGYAKYGASVERRRLIAKWEKEVLNQARHCADHRAVFPVPHNLPVGVRAGTAAFKQLDKSLDEASLMLRASSVQTLRYVVLPLLKPALVAALVYSFVRAITTVSAVIFLVTAENELATTYIIGRVGNGDYGVALAYCTVLIVLMSAATALIQLLVGERKLGRRRAAPPLALAPTRGIT